MPKRCLWLALLLLWPLSALAQDASVLNGPSDPQALSAAVSGHTLCVMTQEGLYAYSLLDNAGGLTLDAAALSAAGVSENALLFAHGAPYLLDGAKVWALEGGTPEAVATLSLPQGRSCQSPVASQGRLYALMADEQGAVTELLSASLTDGSADVWEVEGVTHLAFTPQGELWALRRESPTAWAVVVLDAGTGRPTRTVAKVNSEYQAYMTYSQSMDALFVCVDGRLDRWMGDRWETVRFIPSPSVYLAVEDGRVISVSMSSVNLLSDEAPAKNDLLEGDLVFSTDAP